MLALTATGYLAFGQVGRALEPEPGAPPTSPSTEPATTPKETTHVVAEADDPAPDEPELVPDADEPAAAAVVESAEPDPQVVPTAAPIRPTRTGP